jgi:hypothetical protein
MQSNTSGAVALAAQQTLTSPELEQANLFLRQALDGVVGATKGLSEAQWNFKPAPACWSVAQIVEHVIFVQERILGPMRDQLVTAPAGPANRNCELVDAMIINQFPNRLSKFPAPEFAHPKGNLKLSEGLDRVVANTGKLADLLQTPDLRQHVLESPPLKIVSKNEYQVMDGYQWILAAAAHTERHTKQILEVKADPKFPGN